VNDFQPFTDDTTLKVALAFLLVVSLALLLLAAAVWRDGITEQRRRKADR